MLLKTFYPQTVHLCTYVCSHFGCTNVCYFSFVFCLISPIFYLTLFFKCDVILRGFGFSLPTTTAAAAVASIDVLMLALLPHPAAHICSSIQHGARPSSPALIFIKNLCFTLFFNPCYCFFFFLLYFFLHPCP